MNVNNVTLAMVNAIARYWAKKLSVSAASGIESIALNATKTALVITYKDGTTSQISSDDLMLTAIYDTTATGIVDNSEKLGGMLPSEFATKANLDNFMSLTQANTAGILYVRGGGLNGDGSLFTPYSSLSDAQTAISATASVTNVGVVSGVNAGDAYVDVSITSKPEISTAAKVTVSA